MINEKVDYIFTEVNWDWLVEVPVWPIHAWIIPPGHFRFTVDWEDTLNLDIQMWWKHRWVEQYFYKETDLNKLLLASQDIAWDTSVAYATCFARLVEQSANLDISKLTKLNRILALELERIYNHLWTIWALWNDVWQSFLLNGYLSIREEFLELNNEIFWNRTLKNVVDFWNNWKKISKEGIKKVEQLFRKVEKRIKNLFYIQEYSSWVYDRFKDTWIVTLETARLHSALWLWAKASKLAMDHRVYDESYLENDIAVHAILWIQWDSFDRFQVRAKEVLQSISIIRKVLSKIEESKEEKVTNQNIVLNDWIYTSFVEWHRWEIFQMMVVESWKIVYFKAKDPSFVNWTLIEYAVLKNIIADFPICNKSYDLSYSWFDM
jgi:Ni,Fe-hydrogenase III large subunit